MSWSWRYEANDGTPVAAPGGGEPPMFSSQSDAESWIGEEWQTLLEGGVDAVTLLEEQREVYGPMSLHPPVS